jgi:hypothetical protein
MIRILILTFGLGVSWLAVQSCSRDEAATRDIAGHATLKQGIPHAEPLQRPERYCSLCHGTGLGGGAAGEPSCYQCHGQNWTGGLVPGDVNAAPASHTVANTLGGRSYFHAPEQFTPAGTCGTASCHGTALTGYVDTISSNPGCDLCHDRLWETRTP